MTEQPPGPTRADFAKEVLLHRMKEYSEDFFCAGWIGGLEFGAWNDVDIEQPTDRQKHAVAFSRECRILGEIAGGWWVYEDTTRPGERGPVFIPMERWLQVLAEQSRSDNP